MMNVSIFQINSKKDVNRVRFENYDTLLKIQPDGVDLAIYDVVFTGDFDANDLEDIYVSLNGSRRPRQYIGRSLSVSDIVLVRDSDCDAEMGIYFCDSFGFKKLLDFG